jgi:hypothetical protein
MAESFHQTFFIDSPLTIFDDLQKIVNTTYGIDEYLIAFEATNEKGEAKPHFHFIVFTTEKNLTNLIQFLVKKYNLATKGQQGGRRKYGRLKQPIHNLERLKIYCSKEGNIRTSYSEDILQDLYRKSFKKDDKSLKLKALKYVENETVSQLHVSLEDIRLYIIKFCMVEKIHIRRTLVDAYLIYIAQSSEFTRLRKNATDIYILLYN